MQQTTTKQSSFGSALLVRVWSRSSKNYRCLSNEYRQLTNNLREYRPDYYPFGSSLPTRSWSDASRAYRYGFNGKERDFQTANDAYDFGARIYDGRLGRWMSVDPLMKSIPKVSSYCFVQNSPIYLNDPNGLAANITINNTGNCTGNTITVQTTIILYGPNAKDINLEQLNNLARALGAPRTFIDNEGKEWTITFEIKYIVSDPLTEYASKLDKNSDAYRQLDLSDQNKALPSDVKAAIGFTAGDNILRIDNSEWPGSIKGATGQGANGGGAKSSLGPIIHESFHMLGYGDRYFGMPGVYQPGFNDDVVGQNDNANGSGIIIMPIHYVNLIDFLKTGGYLNTVGQTTKTFGYNTLILDSSCGGSMSCQIPQKDLDNASNREIKKINTK